MEERRRDYDLPYPKNDNFKKKKKIPSQSVTQMRLPHIMQREGLVFQGGAKPTEC
jgi:hypothetical protein